MPLTAVTRILRQAHDDRFDVEVDRIALPAWRVRNPRRIRLGRLTVQ